MIRWSYIFPRLLLLALVILFVVFALDPLVRWSLIWAGQRATGAKIEIDQLESSLLKTAVRCGRVQMADPSDVDHNLLEADDIVLQLDPTELLRRNWVIDRGHVRGLRFDAGRATSGALDDEPEEEDESGGFDFLSGAGERLEDALTGKVQQEVESLETVQVSRELMQRWPAEYEQMDARINHLQQQVDQLKRAYEEARDNPVRALESSQQTLQQIAALQQAPGQLRTEVGRLTAQAQVDRQALDEARQRDMQRIREKADYKNFDTHELVQYLVGDEWSGRIESLLGWLDQAQTLLGGGEPTEEEVKRRRGEDILFPGLTPRPDFLIRSLLVDGEANIGRDRIPFAGVVTDISTEPKIHGRPTVVKLQSTNDGDMKVYAVIDATSDTFHSRAVISVPRLPQSTTTLGRSDQLAVDVAPGSANLWAQIDVTAGSDLTGRILFRRDDVQLTPKVNADYGNKMLTDAWQRSFDDVNNLQAAVDLSGTLTRPKWKIETNLEEQLATGLNAALQQELAARQQQLAGQAQAEIDKHTAQFNQLITEKQQELIGKLNLGEQELNQLRDLIGQNMKLPGLELGRKLQLDKLFKR